MEKVLIGLFGQFREFFKGLGPTKRMSIVAAGVIAIVAVVVISYMSSGRGHVPLFTNVDPEQMPLIVAKLNEKNVPFSLQDSGTSVYVPSEFLHTTQMALMSEIGSSKMGSLGLELFDKQDFGTSNYAQRINYQRALQGELMRSINTLAAVKQSKVILVMPAKKTFIEEGSQATASVVLELKPGKSLTSDQVKGIQYLVGSAVEGLEPDRVTVVDSRGKMLSRAGDQSTAGSTEILELKQKVESELAERIESMLSKVVGQASVIAKVDAQLTHKQVQAVEESIDPDQTAVRSQQSEEESMDGSRTNPSGVPGARANLPGAEDAGQVGFRQGVRKELKTTNFEVPKTVRNVKEMAGALQKVSVAVIVDGVTQKITKEDGTVEEKWSPRSPEEIKKFEDIVKNAIGYNSARGDSVKIDSIQFVAEDFTEAEKILTTIERKKLLQAIFKWALLGFALALVFFVVVRPFMQWITDSFQDSIDDMLPRTIEELEELHSVDSTLPGMSSALPVLEDSVDPDKAESELLKERIISMMESDEEKAANAFNMWLIRKE